MRLQFRGELFNAFNQVNFALPVTNASATNFGQITATRDGDPGRIGQVALKLSGKTNAGTPGCRVFQTFSAARR